MLKNNSDKKEAIEDRMVAPSKIQEILRLQNDKLVHSEHRSRRDNLVVCIRAPLDETQVHLWREVIKDVLGVKIVRPWLDLVD